MKRNLFCAMILTFNLVQASENKTKEDFYPDIPVVDTPTPDQTPLSSFRKPNDPELRIDAALVRRGHLNPDDLKGLHHAEKKS